MAQMILASTAMLLSARLNGIQQLRLNGFLN
jgi:hypothetical protein